LVRVICFWAGSAIGQHAASLTVTKHYAFSEWLSRPIDIIGWTMLLPIFPFIAFALSSLLLKRFFGCFLTCISAAAIVLFTDLISSLVYVVLTHLFPARDIDYPSICFWVVFPVALLVVLLLPRLSFKSLRPNSSFHRRNSG